MTWMPIYEAVKKIPRGKVITYGGLARLLKIRGGARTAGHALAACPAGKGIPWHRVVGAKGRILIREPHAGLQQKLLRSEGVTFTGSSVDLSAHEWRPANSRRRKPLKTPGRRVKKI
jgi:methylated-DNA-protein-cysteine methyltransferase-like protein